MTMFYPFNDHPAIVSLRLTGFAIGLAAVAAVVWGLTSGQI